MSETLLQVENLRTYFHTFRGVVKAVDGVSFSLDEGQVLGIVGVFLGDVLMMVVDPRITLTGKEEAR